MGWRDRPGMEPQQLYALCGNTHRLSHIDSFANADDQSRDRVSGAHYSQSHGVAYGYARSQPHN